MPLRNKLILRHDAEVPSIKAAPSNTPIVAQSIKSYPFSHPRSQDKKAKIARRYLRVNKNREEIEELNRDCYARPEIKPFVCKDALSLSLEVN